MPYSSKMPSGQMSRVSKAPIVACLTCPLCGNLFREATTISECLHTFCKECIHERFSDEEVTSCPMCNVSLGCLPLEKLRADPQLDDVQAKIFNSLPRKAAERSSPPASQAQVTPAPIRRKERSLSSLGVVSVPSTSRSRRARQKAAWVDEDASEEEEDERPKRKRANQDGDDDTDEFEENDGMYCSETLDSDSKSAEKAAPDHEPVSKRPKREPRNKSKHLDSDFLSPLACLAELADADEKKFVSGADDAKDDDRDTSNALTRGGSSLRATKNVRRKPSANGTKNQQPVVITSSHGNGLWFSLAPQVGEDGALPQIETPYLRIKDGKVPVSYVKKYVAKKLDLKSESEVEITCLGQPVVSSLPLESVRKIWLTKGSSLMRPLSQRSVGREFLMVLTYGRNKRNAIPSTSQVIPPPPPPTEKLNSS